tara:strand:- start:1335 stop:2468 length:1134 start_codon:yes stop_codon:yes gene_type:complete
VLSAPLLAATDNKENLKEIRHRIQALQQNLNSKEASKLEAADALQTSEHAIRNSNRILAKLAHDKKQADDSLNQLQIQHKQIKNNIEIARIQLDKLLYQQYLNGQKDYLRLLFNQQNPNQITRNLHYYKQLSLARTEIINSLRINLKELEKLTQASHKKKAEITAIQVKHSLQKEQLEQEKIKHQTILSQISGKISQQQKEINKLKRDEKRVSTLIAQIDKLFAQKNTLISLYNNKLPDSSKEGLPFTSLKGHLNLPVRGELVSRFGSPRSGRHINWKGLFIRSHSGSDVKAIAGGQIVFADWLRGFGNLLIVDHGGSYMSLYGNNKTLHKQVGDIIHSGDTIATVGNSGGNADSGLYFELRHQGKPFDPLTWIKIE